MKKLITLITLSLLVLAAPAMALKVSDINPRLTRAEADRTLSKDYTYTILEDMTVRRSWVLASNKRLSVDFNPQNDQLLMVMLEYGTGTDQQKAAADVRKITGAGKTKWKRMDKKKAEKYDVAVNSHNAKSGSCYAFMEMNKAGNKCRRVTIYPTLPTSNRANLGEADTTSGGETALGNRAGGSVAKVLSEQEAKRLRTPLPTVATASDTPVRRPARVKKPAATADSASAPAADKPSEADVATTTPAEEETESEEEIVDDFEEVKVESRFSLSSLLVKIGFEGVSPAVLIGSAVAVIVLLTLIGMMRKSSERKRYGRYRNGSR